MTSGHPQITSRLEGAKIQILKKQGPTVQCPRSVLLTTHRLLSESELVNPRPESHVNQHNVEEPQILNYSKNRSLTGHESPTDAVIGQLHHYPGHAVTKAKEGALPTLGKVSFSNWN